MKWKYVVPAHGITYNKQAALLLCTQNNISVFVFKLIWVPFNRSLGEMAHFVHFLILNCPSLRLVSHLRVNFSPTIIINIVEQIFSIVCEEILCLKQNVFTTRHEVQSNLEFFWLKTNQQDDSGDC